MHKFKMYIGDWSNDGHGNFSTYVIASNKPVEDVREAHYKIRTTTGIDVEDICSDYLDDEIDDVTVEHLENLGFTFANKTTFGNALMTDKEMAKLWLFLLRKTDPELDLKVIDDDIPTLHFIGFDEQGRHVGQVGYGLFD